MQKKRRRITEFALWAIVAAMILIGGLVRHYGTTQIYQTMNAMQERITALESERRAYERLARELITELGRKEDQ